MKCSYILSSFFKYKLSSLFCLFVCLVIPPNFSQESFLYLLLFLFNLSLPSVDYISNILDACPIKALLELLCVAVGLNITIQASFPHKCSQLVKCKTFNLVVVTFFLDISRFIVDYFI